MLASLAAIAGLWWWLSLPITLTRAPIDPAAKLDCVSYAPFRGQQNPFDPSFVIPAEQIRQDLRQLATISNCVRTYSTDVGLDQVPALAREVGLKVIQGIWLASDKARNQTQISRALALSREFPDVVTSLVVGNEVLLRGEMAAADLAVTIRGVRALSRVPVTYADVWEFWLKNRELLDAVDFVTVHILPYWEDFPVRARNAASHVMDARSRVAVALPGKEILIGETGWPSAGRMREGALPSRTNQARVVSEILEIAKRENFRVNLIEAYDQPWKRQLEGTVGGYWGLFSDDARALKYPPREPIRNYPHWQLQIAAGVIACLMTYAAGFLALRRRPWQPRASVWLGVSISASTVGVMAGLAVERMLLESFGIGGYLQWGALNLAALLVPLFGTYALVRGDAMPCIIELIGPRESRLKSRSQIVLGVALLIVVAIASAMALGFVFDPRYHDFPYAPLTIAAVPMLALALLNRPAEGERPIAEAVFAGLLVMSAGYIAVNEGYLNWQSLWSCGAFVVIAVTLWQARVGQSPAPTAPQQFPTG